VTLLLSVLGVFAAAAAVRSARPATTWAAGIAAAVTVLGVIAVANQTVTAAKTYNAQYQANRALPRSTLDNAGGAPSAAREDFLAFADGRIPRTATVYLQCTPTCGGMDQWVTWRLLPRAFVDRPQDAQWLLLYNAVPKDVGLKSTSPGLVAFDKRLFVAPAPR
jgi:hypothetical protein